MLVSRAVSGSLADPQLAVFVAHPAPDSAEPDVAVMREGLAERARLRTPGPQLPSVRDIRIGELAARLYRPVTGPAPLVVYLHGGGWKVGGLESDDPSAGDSPMPRERGCSPSTTGSPPSIRRPHRSTTAWQPSGVASAPAELDEAPSAVAIAGDSAGGTLAALACLRLRDECPEALPDLQVLLYANTDLTGAQPSMREKATGWGLSADTIRFFNAQWVPDKARWSDPGVSPLHAPDLSGLPSALIVTAEHDPLRDESEAYAHRLREAGVEVELRREPGLIHNFMLLDEISPACDAAADRVADDVRVLLAGGRSL